MFAIDEMAYASPLRTWPPVGKLLLVLALLIGSLLSPTPLVPALVLLVGLGLLYVSCHWRLPNLIALACMETFFMLLISVLIIAFWTPGTPIWSGGALGIGLTLTREGANLGILLALRALAGFTVLLFFASSTPIPHLFWAMRRLGLPAFLAELTILVYRYSFMLLEQMQQMVVAADCRMGFRTLGQSVRSSGQIMANLFARAMDFAERAQTALLCRNFKGEFLPLHEPAGLSAAWVAGPLLLGAALVLLGQLFAKLGVI